MVWMIFQYLGLPQKFSPKWPTFVYTRLKRTLKVILNVKQLGTMKKQNYLQAIPNNDKKSFECNFCTFEFKVPTRKTVLITGFQHELICDTN